MNPESCNIAIRLLFVNASGDLHGWWKRPELPPFWRFYWNDQPGAFVEFDGNRYDLTPDRFLIIAPDTKYKADCPGHARQLYIHFQLGGMYDNITEQVFAGEVKGNIPFRLLREGMAKAGKNDTGNAGAFLALRILTHAIGAAIPTEKIGEQHLSPRIGKVTDILDSGYADLSNEELANQAGLSLSHFIRQFKEETGVSPQQYATRRKMKEACRLLLYREWTIEKIAESLSYKDRYHFSRVFKNTCGISPAAYRKNYTFSR